MLRNLLEKWNEDKSVNIEQRKYSVLEVNLVLNITSRVDEKMNEIISN